MSDKHPLDQTNILRGRRERRIAAHDLVQQGPTADESGWLIERRDMAVPRYFSMRITAITSCVPPGSVATLGSWELDAARYAVRFARRVDAEQFVCAAGLDAYGYDVFVAEHIFLHGWPETRQRHRS